MKTYMKSILRTALMLSLFTSSAALAGAGHDHGESQFSGASASSSFTLDKSVIHNLEVKTAMAELAPMTQTFSMLAQIKLLPEKQAVITPRFAGKVTAIYAKLGDPVSKGQELVTVNPLTVGSAPVTLRAPIDGVLSLQEVVTGEIIQPGDIMMEISDRSDVLAKGITYDIANIDKIKVGQNVKLKIDALPNENFEGKVQRIDQSIDEDKRTFSVYALISNQNKKLLPHMQGSFEISLDSGASYPVLTVPTKAVLGTVGQNFVYVKDGNFFEKRNVALGQRNNGLQEIVNGVFPGEDVVVQGNYQLQYITPEGQKSKIDDHGHAH
jgi:multidrug efflux pump subunit AcrA (membrane-fusion protein)